MAKKSSAKSKKAPAKKAPAKKAPAKKAPAKKEKSETTAKRGPAPLYGDDLKVKLLVDENPKIEGTKAHAKFAVFKNGMTLGKYRALITEKFGPREANPEINHCVDYEYIELY